MHMTSSRRQFIAQSLAFAGSTAFAQDSTAEPIIDIHQHTDYHGRSNDHMIAHQRAMGITTTVLLPAGTYIDKPSTHNGKSNGLAAKCTGNAVCMEIAKAHPKEFFFGVNEITDEANAPAEIEKYLKLGGVIIGEQKFAVECDSAASQKLYELAAAYQVPILLHFQLKTYNFGYERAHKMFEKYPKTNFIGHAQTVWGNIDKNYDWKNNYPKGKVTPGGLTDRYLADYPNFFADMSAGSGLNALTRDEDHTRGFFDRHQDKILYGSDCADHLGRGPGCQGAGTIAMIRKLAPNPKAVRKILFENAKRVLRLEV
ncbi:MAG: amidohydrolase family protein [Verrucomicrobiaceae bacterium]|nr:amidohydrolase family protein [Verrucomicrobiaceae bacterium]